jgi:hypothetical protein
MGASIAVLSRTAIVRLTERYDRLREADARRDEEGCLRAFHEVAGLADGPVAEEDAPTPARVAWLRYDRPRRVDLLALRAGARPVAKFEDLDRRTALGLEQRLRSEGFRTAVVGPYARRFDVALSTPSGPADRYLVAASRGAEADGVIEAERDRSPEGARRAGRLLGYPPCCVERFVALERSPEAASDGINEAALRALLDGPPVHWALHPLCSESPVGFVPCGGRCPLALDFARRVLAAVEREDPTGAAVLRAQLLRPMLIVRVGLFWIFDGAGEGSARRGSVRYSRVAAQDDPSLPWLYAWGARAVGASLAMGDTVTLDEEALLAEEGGRTVARWALSKPMVPRWWLPRSEAL